MLATMRRRLWLLAVLVAFAVCLLSLSASGSALRLAAAARVACGPSSAHTLAADAVARVYVSGGSAYGCAAGGARSYRLGSTGFSIRTGRIEAAHVAGRIAAYGLLTSGVDTGFATVNVRRLSTGTVLAQRSATTRVGVEGFQSIDSLVVKADGAVAWIATANSIGPPKFVRQLVRLDEKGFAVLDSGRAVVAGSLALHRSTLSWRHGAATRTAGLR